MASDKKDKSEESKSLKQSERDKLYDDISFINASIIAGKDFFNETGNWFTDLGKTLNDVRIASIDASQRMGTGLKNYEAITQEISKVMPDMAQLGYNIGEIGKMQSKFTDNIKTNVILSAEALKGIGIISKLGGDGEMMAVNFRRSARSLKTMTEDLESSVKIASTYGVNTSVILNDIAKTMATVDQYRFERGVEGISRMAAQAASMGVSFETIRNLADKIMNPEGAVDMVTNLQLLGVTSANLLDPFKVMYMAQSDMEGLTEEIGKALGALGTFNEETGEMIIPPRVRMEFAELNKTLGMSNEELTKTISQQGKLNAMENKGVFDFLNVTDEQKTMISTLAEFNKEKQGFEITLNDGRTKMVEDLDTKDMKLLLETPKSMEDAAKQQMDYVQSIRNDVNAIKLSLQQGFVGTTVQMDAERFHKTTYDALTKSMTDGIKSLNIKDMLNTISTSVIKDVSDIMSNVANNKDIDISNMFGKSSTVFDTVLTQFSNNMASAIPSALNSFKDRFNTELSDENLFKPMGQSVGKLANDFYGYVGNTIRSAFDMDKKPVIPPTQSPIGQVADVIKESQRTSPSNSPNRTTETEELPDFELSVNDFIIKALPEDTIKIVGGTNLDQKETLDIKNIVNNNNNTTNNVTNTSNVEPINYPSIDLEKLLKRETSEINKEVRIKFDPLVIKLEGDGKSVEEIMDSVAMKNKLINLVTDALSDEYRKIGSSGISV